MKLNDRKFDITSTTDQSKSEINWATMITADIHSVVHDLENYSSAWKQYNLIWIAGALAMLGAQFIPPAVMTTETLISFAAHIVEVGPTNYHTLMQQLLALMQIYRLPLSSLPIDKELIAKVENGARKLLTDPRAYGDILDNSLDSAALIHALFPDLDASKLFNEVYWQQLKTALEHPTWDWNDMQQMKELSYYRILSEERFSELNLSAYGNLAYRAQVLGAYHGSEAVELAAYYKIVHAAKMLVTDRGLVFVDDQSDTSPLPPVIFNSY